MADSESVHAQQQSLEERCGCWRLKGGQLLTQAFPNALRGTPLETQRQAYLDASLRVDQLAVSLGPKHPTLMAAQGAADEARAALSKALDQTLAETNQKKAALDAEAERLRAGLAQLKHLPCRMRSPTSGSAAGGRDRAQILSGRLARGTAGTCTRSGA